MSYLSRSVTAAQRGRSYTGAPMFGTEVPTLPGGGAGNVCPSAPARSGPASTDLRREPGTVTVLYPGRQSGRRNRFLDREAGMATAEYAIATLAAVAFAALLVAVLGSGEVRSMLMGLIRSALTLG